LFGPEHSLECAKDLRGHPRKFGPAATKSGYREETLLAHWRGKRPANFKAKDDMVKKKTGSRHAGEVAALAGTADAAGSRLALRAHGALRGTGAKAPAPRASQPTFRTGVRTSGQPRSR
jgi:hypothetical protein